MKNHSIGSKEQHIEAEILKSAVDERSLRRSRFIPQQKKWEEDLPSNNDAQLIAPRLIQVNEINDIWMELPRPENIMWGGAWIGVISSMIPTIVLAYVCAAIYFSSKFNFPFFLVVFLGLSFVFSMFWLNLRMALFVPRSTPIRFNRKRKRIYVYEYQRKWNPWVRWLTIIKVFDWADIQAEIGYESDRYTQGYRLYGVVCKPGTTEVIERFILSWSVGDPKLLRGLWSYSCQYMQQKQVPMRPHCRERPRTWCPWDNIHWPKDIDKESTTAPDV